MNDLELLNRLNELTDHVNLMHLEIMMTRAQLDLTTSMYLDVYERDNSKKAPGLKKLYLQKLQESYENVYKIFEKTDPQLVKDRRAHMAQRFED